MKIDPSRRVLATLALCAVLPALGTSIANVALPTLASDFNASFHDVQWVVLAYLIANTAVIGGVGRLGDMVGRRLLLVRGLVIFSLASLACAMAPALATLHVARAAQGVGAAILMALSLALVGDAVPRARAGRAMGLLGTMSAIGTALGPSLGGLLIAAFGWRSIFLLCALVGGAAMLLVHQYLVAEALPVHAPEGGAIARGIVVVRATFSTFRRIADPGLRSGLAMTGLVSTVMMATLIAGPFHLSTSLGLGPGTVGLVMSTGPIVSAVTGVPAGVLVDRFGARPMTGYALFGLAAAAAALCLAPLSWGIAGYVVPLVTLTAHYALFQAANNTAVMSDLPAGTRGAVSGVLNLARNLGLIAGGSILGAAYAAYGLRTTFAAATVLILAAFLVFSRSAALHAKGESAC